MSNYFQTQGYASNSALSQLGKELGLLPSYETTPEAREENFRIGTLFDILETEPHRINRIFNTIVDTDYSFTDEELGLWERKQKLLYSQKWYREILNLKPDFQTEFYHNNYFLEPESPIRMKGKLDLLLSNPLNKSKGMVIDLKTTKAKSQKEFENTCNMFGYFRQMIYYMVGVGVRKSLIIGVSKETNQIYKVYFDANHKDFKENFNMCKLLVRKWFELS